MCVIAYVYVFEIACEYVWNCVCVCMSVSMRALRKRFCMKITKITEL